MSAKIPRIQDGRDMRERLDYRFLYDAVIAARPRIAVELGVQFGHSAVLIASALPDNGHLWAVDSWESWYNQMLPDAAIERATKRIAESGYEPKITILRSRSVRAATEWRHGLIDFLHIDAEHSSINTFADIIAWASHLNNNAVIVGHDWQYPSVKEAVGLAMAEGIFKTFDTTDHQYDDRDMQARSNLPQQWKAVFSGQKEGT